jgi:hypothetical protein
VPTTASLMASLSHTSRVAPISTLPNELLAEIFIRSTPNLITLPCTIFDNSFPWALSLVCKWWRSVVLGTPELWANIWLQYSLSKSKGARDFEARTKIAHIGLARSADSFVSLKVTFSILHSEDWGMLTSLISNHAHRLIRLELNVLGKILGELPPFRQMHFDNLKDVSISSHYGIPQSLPFTLFQNSPLLRVLELKADLSLLTMAQDLPWAQLTSLSMKRTWGRALSANLAHIILRQCSNLNHLYITLSSEEQPGSADIVIKTLPCPFLQTLLVEVQTIEIATFLKPLILPCLAQLELICPAYINLLGWDHSLALDTVSSFSQLKGLKIDLCIPIHYEMSGFLKSLGGLISFTLPPCAHLSQSTFTLLSSVEVLPELQVLHSTVSPNSLSAHLQMLNARVDSGGKTRGVFLRPPNQFHFSDDDNYLTEKLTKRGLLQFTYSKYYYSPNIRY